VKHMGSTLAVAHASAKEVPNASGIRLAATCFLCRETTRATSRRAIGFAQTHTCSQDRPDDRFHVRRSRARYRVATTAIARDPKADRSTSHTRTPSGPGPRPLQNRGSLLCPGDAEASVGADGVAALDDIRARRLRGSRRLLAADEAGVCRADTEATLVCSAPTPYGVVRPQLDRACLWLWTQTRSASPDRWTLPRWSTARSRRASCCRWRREATPFASSARGVTGRRRSYKRCSTTSRTPDGDSTRRPRGRAQPRRDRGEDRAGVH